WGMPVVFQLGSFGKPQEDNLWDCGVQWTFGPVYVGDHISWRVTQGAVSCHVAIPPPLAGICSQTGSSTPQGCRSTAPTVVFWPHPRTNDPHDGLRILERLRRNPKGLAVK